MTRTATYYAWAASIIGLVIFEMWTLFNKIPNDTLSEAVWDVAPRRLIIPLTTGLVCGHLFGQLHFQTWKPLALFLAGVLLGVVAWQSAK